MINLDRLYQIVHSPEEILYEFVSDFHRIPKFSEQVRTEMREKLLNRNGRIRWLQIQVDDKGVYLK